MFEICLWQQKRLFFTYVDRQLINEYFELVTLRNQYLYNTFVLQFIKLDYKALICYLLKYIRQALQLINFVVLFQVINNGSRSFYNV